MGPRKNGAGCKHSPCDDPSSPDAGASSPTGSLDIRPEGGRNRSERPPG
ncbi:MAG: hypothetical protein ACFFBZ_14470 [Promethearchaeota archaeon]